MYKFLSKLCLWYLCWVNFTSAVSIPQKILFNLDFPTHQVREQNDSICDARSRQWTGSVQVTPEKNLFFWFFESRNDPINDPVIVWLTGGPGGSSMLGLFTEMGPCILSSDSQSTVFNPYSWTNNASVIFLDQPAGVGFSTVKDNQYLPGTLQEAAVDFARFLKIFFSDLFPTLQSNDLHIAGESFGGHWVPYFVQFIEKQRPHHNPAVFSGNIKSVIYVDGYIEPAMLATGYYDLLCHGPQAIFNRSTCVEMAKAVPECERLGRECLDTCDKDKCTESANICDNTMKFAYDAEIKAGRRSPFHLKKGCSPENPCELPDGSDPAVYLNLPHVKSLLGKSDSTYSWSNDDIEPAFKASGDMYVPSNNEVTYLLDIAGINTLVLNGELDVVVNTPGQIRVFDALPWSGQAEYRASEFIDWYYNSIDTAHSKTERKNGGKIKGTEKLLFATIKDAGHMCPADQKEAVEHIVTSWVHDKWASLLD